MDKTLIAIGGGELKGWSFKTKDESQTFYDLENIDNIVRSFSGKDCPNLLFIGTASKEHPLYIKAIKGVYEKLGCNVCELNTIGRDDFERMKEEVLNADIIYIGGGNTRNMLAEWDRVGLKEILIEAYNKGIIIAGYSAGAYAMFYTNYEEIDGLNLIDAVVCAHYNDKSEEKRNQFYETIKLKNKIGIALDNCTALVYRNEKMEIIKSDENAKAFKIEYLNNEYVVEEL